MATDFIGFTIDGVHSKDLGLYRVSDGSRYNDDLVPPTKDVTVEVPGGDGSYYFGSYFTQRTIPISVAFDDLSESQFRQIKHIIGSKKIQELVFDEAPYKTYYVKASGSQSLKYICFDKYSDENGTERVYKGEGMLNFIAFDPFAHCTKKFKEQYEEDNIEEWIDAAGLASGGEYDIFANGTADLYNPGDIETDWILITESMPSSLSIDGEVFMTFSGSLENGEKLYLDSKKNLAFSKKDDSDSITLRNDCIKSGHWKKIPLEESQFTVEGNNTNPSIEYDYLYL